MSEVDQTIARAQGTLDRMRERSGERAHRSRKRRQQQIGKRIVRIAIADVAIIVAAIVIGWIVPLGMFGALAVMAALIAATLFFAIFPVEAEVQPEKFHETPLKALPRQTESWLERQRPALPAPAANLIDSIGERLDTLGLQIANLDEREPAAAEIRKLVGEELPELINGYKRVPEPLRRVDRHGVTPDAQLVQGLKLIEEEIGQMTAQLAQGDLDLLATRGRYLQIRYRGDDEIGGPGSN